MFILLLQNYYYLAQKMFESLLMIIELRFSKIGFIVVNRSLYSSEIWSYSHEINFFFALKGCFNGGFCAHKQTCTLCLTH